MDADDEASNNDDDNTLANNSSGNSPNHNEKFRSASTPMQPNISNQTQYKNYTATHISCVLGERGIQIRTQRIK